MRVLNLNKDNIHRVYLVMDQLFGGDEPKQPKKPKNNDNQQNTQPVGQKKQRKDRGKNKNKGKK